MLKLFVQTLWERNQWCFSCHWRTKVNSGRYFSFSLGSWLSVLVHLVTAEVTLEHSDWLAAEMSLRLIYNFGLVHENLKCLGEAGIMRFCSFRVLANAKERDVM